MFINDKRGIALVSVLIIVAIVSLLGTTVWYANSQEVLASERDENKTQAYYFARSGVEMALELILGGHCEDSNKEYQYYGQLDGAFIKEKPNSYNTWFQITIDDARGKYIIDSEGIAGTGVAGVAKAKSGLRFEIDKSAIEEYRNSIDSGNGGLALFAKEAITLHAKVVGNVATNAMEPSSVEFRPQGKIISGNLYIGPGSDKDTVVTFDANRDAKTSIPNGNIFSLQSALQFSMPTFPDSPNNLDSRGDLDFNKKKEYSIEEDSFYNSIVVKNGDTLIIKLDGGDRVVKVNNINIDGDIVLDGSGKLLLYVEEDFNIKGGGQVNHGGDSLALVLYYAGVKELDIRNNTEFAGSVYAKEATIDISGNIKGNVISSGNTVNISGSLDYTILYAPNADVEINNGDLRGIVVANTCTVDSGNKVVITSGSFDTTFFNSLDWGANAPPSLFLSEQYTPEKLWRKGTWTKII